MKLEPIQNPYIPVNNVYCYLPLDLEGWVGRVNKTAEGAYCAPWDEEGSDPLNNFCVTSENPLSTPGPWCLEKESRNPVLCGVPVCGNMVRFKKLVFVTGIERIGYRVEG